MRQVKGSLNNDIWTRWLGKAEHSNIAVIKMAGSRPLAAWQAAVVSGVKLCLLHPNEDLEAGHASRVAGPTVDRIPSSGKVGAD